MSASQRRPSLGIAPEDARTGFPAWLKICFILGVALHGHDALFKTEAHGALRAQPSEHAQPPKSPNLSCAPRGAVSDHIDGSA